MRFIIFSSNKDRFGSHLNVLIACFISLLCQPTNAEPALPGVQAIVELQARNLQVCAVAFATVRAGKISISGSAKGCDRGLESNADSVFQAASLSKPVFAYAVLKLAQAGALSLDAPLVSYLPNGYHHIQNPFAFGKPPITEHVVAPELQAVTARMVLTHTSGLPNWSSDPLAFDFKPGTDWQYSGEGFMLLQRVVESITNQRLDEFMRHRLFDPLGMSNSAFRWKQRFTDAFVPGLPRHVHIPEALAPFSLHTSANDYAKFLAALLTDQLAMQQTVHSPANVIPKLGLSWGLGWGIERSEKDSFFWQWGNNPGYRAFVMASPSSGDAVIMLTNSEDGLAMAEQVVTAVLPGTHKVFKSYLVREGVSYFVCKNLGWCI